VCNISYHRVLKCIYLLTAHSPLSVWSISLVSTSYRLAVWSHDAVMTWSPPGNQSAAITTPVCPVNSQTGVRRLGMPSDAATSSSYSSFSHTSTSSSDECPFFNTQYGDKHVKLPTACHESVETGQNKLNSLLYVSKHSYAGRMLGWSSKCWQQMDECGEICALTACLQYPYTSSQQCLSMCAVICITESQVSVFHPSSDCSPLLYSKTNTSILLCNTAQTLNIPSGEYQAAGV